MSESKREPGNIWIAIALAAATAVAYMPVLSNGFVNYDDDLYILNNPYVKGGLGADTLRWAFTTFRGANWFPLTWLSWASDFSLYGDNAAGFHLTSLLLHIANTLLLFLAFVRLSGARWCSALLAGLFALHPLHVESVAWAAARKDVLSGFFAMLTLLAYERFVRRGPQHYPAVVIFLALGLMAKPMLVTWPFVLLLLDLWPLDRLRDPSNPDRWESARVRRAVFEKLPLFALVAATSIVAIVSQDRWGTVQALERLPLSHRLANAVTAYVDFLVDAFRPVGLAVFYPHPAGSFTTAHVLGAAGLLLCVTALAFILRRRHPEIAVGWFWFIGTLVPVIGLVQVGQAARADRYTYLPLIGLSLPLVWAAAGLAARGRGFRLLVAGLSITALFALGVTTHLQARRWHDSRSLFEHALSVTERNHVAHINLGVVLHNDGEHERAALHLSRALQLVPASAKAAGVLADVRLAQGRGEESLSLYRRAIEIEPKIQRWHEGLGNAFLDLDHPDHAIESYRTAVAINAQSARLQVNLGLALIRAERWEEAEGSLRNALALNSNLAEAHGNLGIALEGAGDRDGAITAFDAALERSPEFAAIHAHAGKLRAERGEFAGALAHLAESARLEPENAAFSAAYARVLDRAGHPREAAAEYRRGLGLGERRLPAIVGLAKQRLVVGDSAEAVLLAEEATTVTRREIPAVLALLGEAYAAEGRLEDAAQVTEEAARLALARGSKGVHASLDRRAKAYRAAMEP
ncbi:MAG: tetratricopeptide repeat protein [Deltaproteobacteria bacterium]|nr:tetratricopeptide repeat protein [Deltaproteobacteria bacterium]